MLVGAFIKREKFHYSRSYGFLLIFESVLLFFCAHLYNQENIQGIIVASFSMGLQNSLFTNFSGAVVRTTHVTGLLTDIGIHFGHLIRWREKTKEFWRVYILIPLFFGFISGGVLGTWSFDIMGVWAFIIPAIILGTIGTVWSIWRMCYTHLHDNKKYAEMYH